MGSVTSVLNSTGEVLERRSYDAFGQMTCMLPDGTPVPASPTGLKVGFQGQLIDELTGMYQMGYRWYSPVLGRWMSRDPIGLEGGVNLLTYAENSPQTMTDELGLAAVRIWLIQSPCPDESFLDHLFRYLRESLFGRSPDLVLVDPTGEELRNVLKGVSDASIEKLEVSGHGSRAGIAFSRHVMGIVMMRANASPVYSDRPSITFAESVKKKLSAGAEICLGGCNTASDLIPDESEVSAFGSLIFPWNWRHWYWLSKPPGGNLAQTLSANLPGVDVTGSAQYSVGTPEVDLKWLSLFDTKRTITWTPLTRTYRNGSLK